MIQDRLPELVAAYPNLFASEEFAEVHSDLPAGWYALMAQLCQRISEELAEEERFSILQIKEKLGHLRIRYRGPERLFALVDAAAQASRQHCAVCGRPIVEPARETALPLCQTHAE
jgi:hypothetical protein